MVGTSDNLSTHLTSLLAYVCRVLGTGTAIVIEIIIQIFHIHGKIHFNGTWIVQQQLVNDLSYPLFWWESTRASFGHWFSVSWYRRFMVDQWWERMCCYHLRGSKVLCHCWGLCALDQYCHFLSWGNRAWSSGTTEWTSFRHGGSASELSATSIGAVTYVIWIPSASGVAAGSWLRAGAKARSRVGSIVGSRVGGSAYCRVWCSYSCGWDMCCWHITKSPTQGHATHANGQTNQ